MEIVRDRAAKIMEIWLSKADQSETDIEDRVQELVCQGKAEGLFPCIYRSGNEDLWENTAQLLVSNKKQLAKKQKLPVRQVV